MRKKTTERIMQKLEIIEREVVKTVDREKKLRKAVCLLNSMVEGGESHSETSRKIVYDALHK